MSTPTAAPITVPLLDLKIQYAALRKELEPVVNAVLQDAYYIMGPDVAHLEREIATYCKARHAVGCANGSDAILLALMALNIQPGDEVICPSYTFFATAGSIARLGAKPVFADIDPVTYNMSPAHTRELAKSCKRLKAIMPVHLFGQAADLDAFLDMSREFKAPIIEDAAQAIGTRDARGLEVGSRGAIGTFSFFPSKNLGAFGDGGILTTNCDHIAERMGILRVHGGKPKYYHKFIGINSRLDSLQAAILRVKLRHLDAWHAGRLKNAEFYDAAFRAAGALDSATPLAAEGTQLRFPYRPPAPARHIYNQYVIRVPAAHRDPLRDHLKNHNIGTEIYYPVPLHMQECFAYLGCPKGTLPHSEAAAAETIALPIYPELTTDQLRHVADSIIAYLSANGLMAPRSAGARPAVNVVTERAPAAAR